jgi:hypothetical protein
VHLHGTIRRATAAAALQFVDVRRIFDNHEVCGKDGGWITHIVLRREGPGESR